MSVCRSGGSFHCECKGICSRERKNKVKQLKLFRYKSPALHFITGSIYIKNLVFPTPYTFCSTRNENDRIDGKTHIKKMSDLRYRKNLKFETQLPHLKNPHIIRKKYI